MRNKTLFLGMLAVGMVLAAPAGAQTSLITGVVRDPGGQPLVTRIDFETKSTPLVVPVKAVQPHYKLSITNAVDGGWTNALYAGDYLVTIRGTGGWKDSQFFIAVPTNVGNYAVTDLITTGMTYTNKVAPIWWLPRILTARGDLVVFDGTNVVRLPVGSQGKVLVTDTNSAQGVKWGTVTGSGGDAYLANDQAWTGFNSFSNISAANVVTNIDLAKTRLFVIGDSLSAAPGWLYWLTNNARYASVWATNAAVAGHGINSTLAILTNNVLPLRDANYTDIICWWGGANEHPYYTAAEYAFDPAAVIGGGGHSNACVMIRNAGFKLMLFSTLPRNVLTTFNRAETNRYHYNEWFEQCGLWDYYVDTAAMFSNNKGSQFEDGTHLTTNSYRVVADMVDQALRSGSRNLPGNWQPYSGWSQVGTNYILQGPDGAIIATVDAAGRWTLANNLALGATASDPMITRSAGQIYFRSGDDSAFVPVRAKQFIATSDSGNPMEINTNYLVATSLGRVGIGTNAPAQKLDVLGIIRHLGLIGVGTSSADQHWVDSTPSKATRRNIDESGNLMLGVYDGSAWHNIFTLENATRTVKIGTNDVVFAPGQQTNWLGGLTRMNDVVVLGTFTLSGMPQTPSATDKVIFSVDPDGNFILSDLTYSNVATKTWVVEQGYGTGGGSGGTYYAFSSSYFTVTNGTNVALRGYEAVRNGGFSSSTANWTAVTANIGVQSGGQAGNCLAITNTGAGNGSALQTFSTIPGVTYTVTGYFKNPDGIGYTGKILAPGGAFVDCEATDWTQYSVEFTALATESTIELINAQFDAPDSVVYFDSISVTGYHDLGRAQATEDWVLSRGYSTGGGGAGTVSNVAMRAGTMILMTGETNITTSGTNTVAVDTNALATFVQAEIDATTATLTNGPNVGVATNAAGDVYPYVPSGVGLTNITAMGYLRVGDSNNILAALNGMDWGFFDYAAERLDIGVYMEPGKRILATGTDQTELNGPLLLMDTNLVDGELLKLDGSTVRSAGVAAADLLTGIIVESNSVVIASNITRINFANPTTITSNASIATVTLPTGGEGSGVSSNDLENLRWENIGITVDGSGDAVTTGLKGHIQVPYNCVIWEWTILADQSGSITFDVWKDTYANYPPTVADTITAAAKPGITTAAKNTSSTLTGWSTNVTAGDILSFNVDSASTLTRATIMLKVKRNLP